MKFNFKKFCIQKLKKRVL